MPSIALGSGGPRFLRTPVGCRQRSYMRRQPGSRNCKLAVSSGRADRIPYA